MFSSAAEDYAPFNAVWNQPDGGLHTYLVRFLGSPDQTFQHIAVWVSRRTRRKSCVPFLLTCLRTQTIVQLLEAEDDELTNHIRSSPILLSLIKQLASADLGSPSASPSRQQQQRQQQQREGAGGSNASDAEDDEDAGSSAGGEGGAGEIAALAGRILDLTEGGRALEDERSGGRGSGMDMPGGPPGQQSRPQQPSQQQQGPGSLSASLQTTDHAALRASVHQALNGGAGGAGSQGR